MFSVFHVFNYRTVFSYTVTLSTSQLRAL